MRKFPLPLRRKVGCLIVLDDEQAEWLRRYYPSTENIRIAKAMGVSIDTVRRLKDVYGLSKSKRGMAAIRRRQQKKSLETNIRMGIYDRKRGKPVSEATLRGLRQMWRDVQSGERESPIAIMRRKNPEGYALMLEKRRKERKDTIRKEKMRILYGLERKTRLKTVVMQPYTQSQAHRRCSALKRGYLLAVDCSEGTEGRYTLYYDDETQRSAKFEENCKLDGFKIERDNG